MQRVSLLLLLGLAGLASASPARSANDEEAKYALPEGFLFGAGTSAYQSEGAWDQDGKGENVFDYYYHSRNCSADVTGDVAADAYHRYKEDIDLAVQLGLDVLRISISWARIFPDGRSDNVNPNGVQHYHDVLDYMRANNIEPLVTIFHFDYPQVFEAEFGGWLSDKMPPKFEEFADFLFNEYGRKVKYWLTVNEAHMYCNLANGMVPPATISGQEKNARCLHNLIIAHALAHKVYHDKYAALYGGMVGFGVGPDFSRAASDSAEDVAAADKDNLGHGIGLSIEPLFTGDYPAEGKTAQRPEFTDEQRELLKGRIDFAGVNIYSGRNASASGGGGPPRGHGGPRGGRAGDPGDKVSGDGCPGGHGGGGGPPGGDGGPDGGGGGGGGHGSHDTSTAWVMREVPKWVNKRYNNLPVFFTESGTGSGSSLDDRKTRAVFASAYLRELAAGLNEDKTNVIGYTMWSFIDSYEFGSYGIGWGMVHVDYTNGTLKRTLKKSSGFFKRLAKTRVVPLVEEGTPPYDE